MSRSLLVCLFTLLLTTVPIAAKTTGVAFVHGTGVYTGDAADAYWTWEFIDTVRDGLTDRDNYTVINCNFDVYAWEDDAAGCLAQHLDDLVVSRGIDDLVVITHSNGGNVMRWLLSNPTWDPRYPTITDATRAVVALAPSSGGSPLADAVVDGNVFEEALGWLLGYASDAIQMQTTGDMALYNSNGTFHGTAGQPALPVPFYNVVGSGVDSSPLDLDSFCGDYAETLALEITQLYLGSCSDGFLDCWSQELAGTASIHDVRFTEGDFDVFFEPSEEPLNHSQIRRPCFGLTEKLRDLL